MPTNETPGLLEVGRVTKTHGLRGRVIVDPITNRPERFASGAQLIIGGNPFTVTEASAHGTGWNVQFAEVSSLEEAEMLRGAEVFGVPLVDLDLESDEFWAHDLIGCEMRSTDGAVLGTVEALVENPGHDLLEITGGALIPMPFVQSVSDGIVTVELPEGLL